LAGDSIGSQGLYVKSGSELNYQFELKDIRDGKKKLNVTLWSVVGPS
jgi:hypothetical protein